MKRQLRIYKTLEKPASLYVEANGFTPPFTITLFVDGEPVLTLDNENNRVLALSQTGLYSATVQSATAQISESNNVRVYETDIQPQPLENIPETSDPSLLKTRELVLDENLPYFLEIKIKKNSASLLRAELHSLAGMEGMRKKQIRLDNFPKDHSIHGYEYYLVDAPARREDSVELCNRLESLDYVIYCSMTPDTRNLTPPDISNHVAPETESSIDSTPDFSRMQGYLDEYRGMNVRNVWARDNSGQGATVRHLDFGIYKDHQDFQGGNITVVSSRDENKDCNHGTASTGCIAAANNGFGVIGIAHSASFYFYDTDALHLIMEDSLPGDIVSLDIQFGFENGYVPAIMIKSWWDSIKNMTEKNVIVIMAAGNSGFKLNENRFPDYGNSGGVVIGACSSSTGRRLGFSNYGHYASTLNSWGEYVTTTGYGDLQDLAGNYRDYTDGYHGTSSATPLCAGALALLQAHAKKKNTLIVPGNLREVCQYSNYTEGVIDLIGRRLNVEKVIVGIDKMALAPLANINPLPPGYASYDLEFKLDQNSTQSIYLDYRSTTLINTGVVAHYEDEGPTRLEWYSYGSTLLTVPLVAENGSVEVAYFRVSKVNNGGTFTMNSGADISGYSPGAFTLRFDLLNSDNKFLSKWKYHGILPLYVNAYNSTYSGGLKINIKIN